MPNGAKRVPTTKKHRAS